MMVAAHAVPGVSAQPLPAVPHQPRRRQHQVPATPHIILAVTQNTEYKASQFRNQGKTGGNIVLFWFLDFGVILRHSYFFIVGRSSSIYVVLK